MFNSSSKFSKNERRMDRYEILQAISYYTEEQVNANMSGKGNPFFDALPKPYNESKEKEKLEEALKQFELTPKE